MRFDELKNHLSGGDLFPCYYVAGEDAYLVKLALERFFALVEIKELNVSVFEGNLSVVDVVNAAETLPAFGSLRVVVAPAKIAKDLGAYLKNPCKSSIIVLVGDAKESKDGGKGVSGIPKEIHTLDCNRLPDNLLSAYVLAKLKKANGVIAPNALGLLIEYCSRYLGRIMLELDKLISFKAGAQITEEDVKLMVAADLEYKVFELSDAVVRRDSARALRILNDMLQEGAGASAKIFGLMYGHFRRLLYTAVSPSDGGLSDKLGVKDYAISVARRQAGGFTKAKLKAILDRLHEADANIKSGRMADKQALTDFIVGACA